MDTQDTSRRDFLRTSATAAFGAMVVPRHVLGGPGYQAPSDTLNIAAIGAGGMGGNNLQAVTSQNVVALCDVDWERAKESFDQFPQARRYRDFRVMLDDGDDIDAVIIATPDHTHAVAAQACMQMDKHVFVQKPLTTTINEARTLLATAQETGVAAQMGNQGRSGDGGRRVNELIRAGVIGTVTEVHAWTNRPIWPQGITHPEAPEDLPDHVAWDLFLGPAPYRQYHSAYHPFAWRGWTDYGVGALGDMGAHLIDHAIWSLELPLPSRVEVSSTDFNGVSYPNASMTHFTFERDEGPLDLTWYDGGLKPPLAKYLPRTAETVPIGMVLYVGEDGVLLHESYGNNPRVFPAELQDEAREVPQSIPRVETSHEMNWVNACKGEAELTSPFETAVPVTETLLLGIVALRAGAPIEYDADAHEVTTPREANQYLSREYRRGWSL